MKRADDGSPATPRITRSPTLTLRAVTVPPSGERTSVSLMSRWARSRPRAAVRRASSACPRLFEATVSCRASRSAWLRAWSISESEKAPWSLSCSKSRARQPNLRTMRR